MQGSDTPSVIAPGLPNITGSVGGFMAYENLISGALTYSDENKQNCGSPSAGVKRTIYFNAANSNAIYGASDTVQPNAISLIPQIRF